jgi:SAM-dependent methyltransferase
MRRSQILTMAREARIVARIDVLDLCCGIAGPGRFIAAQFGCSYLGVDLSAGAVDIARQRARDLPCQFEVARIPPTPPGPFDVVLLLETMLAFSEKDTLLRATANALTPGGRFAFTVEAGPPLTEAERSRMPDADTVWLTPLPEILEGLLQRLRFPWARLGRQHERVPKPPAPRVCRVGGDANHRRGRGRLPAHHDRAGQPHRPGRHDDHLDQLRPDAAHCHEPEGPGHVQLARVQQWRHFQDHAHQAGRLPVRMHVSPSTNGWHDHSRPLTMNEPRADGLCAMTTSDFPPSARAHRPTARAPPMCRPSTEVPDEHRRLPERRLLAIVEQLEVPSK